MLTALDLGLIYGLMALGVHLTFRVLDIVDLTVDSSFTTGAAVTAVMITTGQSPWLATLGDFLAGCVAEAVTGLLRMNAGIHPLLAGILTQINLCSINLRIFGKANAPLLHGVEALLTPLRDKGLLGPWISILIFAALIAIVTTPFSWFLSTQIGLGIRSTGDNEGMARTRGVSAETMEIIGLALSSGLVASSGVIAAQYQGYMDILMGIGLVIADLASVIIGTALIGSQGVWVTSLFVVIGSIVYRIIIQFALGIEFFKANNMRLISVIIVFAALITPQIDVFSKIREHRRNHNLVPEPGITHTPEERSNEKVVF